MFGLRKRPNIESQRMTLRLPVHGDYRAWAELREISADHLIPWEPVRAEDHLSRKAFTNRVYWAGRADAQGTALPLMMIRRVDNVLLGAITLDNIRRGPVQAGTLGYWIGAPFARQSSRTGCACLCRGLLAVGPASCQTSPLMPLPLPAPSLPHARRQRNLSLT